MPKKPGNRARQIEKQIQSLMQQAQALNIELQALQKECKHQWCFVGQGFVEGREVRRYRCALCRLVDDRRVDKSRTGVH